MSSALKNRLVGTVIVVALVVIFLPELLDGEKQVNNNVFIDVPKAPESEPMRNVSDIDAQDVIDSASRPMTIVDETPVDADSIDTANSPNPENTGEISPNSAGSDAQNSDAQDSVSATSSEQTQNQNEDNDQGLNKSPEQPEASDSEPEISVKDSGWVIQLGSFSDESNAKQLIRTLTNAGYRAYSRPIQTRLGVLTKVFVGPEIKRENLESALPHLQEITGLNGKITEFEVSAG